MWLQLLFVLLAIIVGARVGGIGLGVFGGLGTGRHLLLSLVLNPPLPLLM